MIKRRVIAPVRLTRRRLFSAAMAVTGGIAGVSVWPARCNGKFYPGATLLGLDLGGLTRAEARVQLRQRLAHFESLAVVYRHGRRFWTASASDLGVKIDYDDTLDRAWTHGRDHGLRGRYTGLLSDQHEIEPLVMTLDTAVLEQYLRRLSQKIAIQVRDASLFLKDNEVSIRPAQPGVRLDVADTREQTLAVLRTASPGEIELRAIYTPPRITTSDIIDAKTTASTLIGSDIEVKYGDSTWAVTTSDLAAALNLPHDPVHDQPTLDAKNLRVSLVSLADEINHPPRNATVAWDNGLYAISKSYDGAEVDLDQLVGDVITAASTSDRSVDLPLIYSPPEVDSANLNALGITTRIGHGVSSFAGSAEARATNVAVAADHVSHTLIAPGATFSFNDALGPITLDEGYVEGKIISGDWYASDLGGGVCQVSTTVFRAALLAGLPFVEWHPHSFRLSFYELDGWPVGMDAAIYQPNNEAESELDMRFSNPTDSWMLLQMRIDGESIVADLYGAASDLDVRISDPQLGDPVAPPDPIERPTDQLQPGEREQIQLAQPGLTVTMTRRVVDGDRVIEEDTFVSPYRAQPDVYLVGRASG